MKQLSKGQPIKKQPSQNLKFKDPWAANDIDRFFNKLCRGKILC